MIQTHNWQKPCGCSADYTWNDSTDFDSQDKVLSQITNKCPLHSSWTDQQVWDWIGYTVNFWNPDTCGCKLEFEFDRRVAANNRIRKEITKPFIGNDGSGSFVMRDGVYKKCIAHSLLTNKDQLAAVTEEGDRKKLTMLKAAELFTNLFPQSVDQSGATITDYGKFSWSYDSQRVLNVSVVGLSAAKKTQLQSACDTLLGAGKVKVS